MGRRTRGDEPGLPRLMIGSNEWLVSAGHCGRFGTPKGGWLPFWRGFVLDGVGVGSDVGSGSGSGLKTHRVAGLTLSRRPSILGT